MKIDFHTHVWNDQLKRVDEFIAALDQHGIDQACVLPIAPYMSNDDVSELVRRGEGRIIGFASVLPFAETTGITRMDPVDDLKRAVTELGLRGVKLHPMIQGFDMADPGLVPVVSAAGELGVPVLFHTGPSNGRAGRLENARIEKLDDLAIMCPGTVLVAGHANPLSAASYLARKHPNVYLETSIAWPHWCNVIPGLAAKTIEHAGANKVLYGTDFSLGREERVTAVDKVLLELSEPDRALVAGANAQRLLNV